MRTHTKPTAINNYKQKAIICLKSQKRERERAKSLSLQFFHVNCRHRRFRFLLSASSLLLLLLLLCFSKVAKVKRNTSLFSLTSRRLVQISRCDLY